MDILPYLKARRSALSLTLEEPGPSSTQLHDMLTVAARVPDHGKLAPWRFELWEKAARKRMHAQLVEQIDCNSENAAKLRGGTDKLLHAPCVVAVISTAREHESIPQWEQVLSAGAVCLNLLMAANAHGFEAQWLTAWYIYDDKAKHILDLDQGERVAGIIHIGSTAISKSERPRPNIEDHFKIRSV